MRLYSTFLFISIVVILGGCQSGKESGKSDTGKNIPDTLIYSSPKNYLKVLDDIDNSSKVEIRDYKDMFALFEKLNYTPEAWQAGIREVPRVYLPIIGEKWGPTN